MTGLSIDCRLQPRLGPTAHEVGHAACYRGGDFPDCYGTEGAADAHVRCWGFGDELAALYEEAMEV